MAVLPRARRVGVLLVVIAIIGVATVTAYLCRLRLASSPQEPSAPGRAGGQFSELIYVEELAIVEDGESATVIWNATIHTEFSLNGTSRSPGETIKLTTRVVRAEDVWKLIKLHDGVENDPQ